MNNADACRGLRECAVRDEAPFDAQATARRTVGGRSIGRCTPVVGGPEDRDDLELDQVRPCLEPRRERISRLCFHHLVATVTIGIDDSTSATF